MFLEILVALGVISGFGVLSCFAEESITITTYYPSPYGSYNALQTNRLAVGDTNNNGQITDADLPNRNGDIRLKPQSGNPSSWPIGEEGQLAYSQTNDELYHSNGTSWVAQGGDIILVNGSSCPIGYSPLMNYYSSKTCTAIFGSCTTGAGWGLPLPSYTAHVDSTSGVITAPGYLPISLRPSCSYNDMDDRAVLCYASNVTRTICVKD